MVIDAEQVSKMKSTSANPEIKACDRDKSCVGARFIAPNQGK